MRTMRSRGATALLALCMLTVIAGGAADAQRMEPLPKELEGVGIEEKPNGAIPLDLRFVDEQGRDVRLGDYFGRGRPVLLTLVYYSCPMLCTLVLNGMTDAMKEMSWTPGDEFEVVTVSFDPSEGPTLAKLKKQVYIEAYGKPEAAPGWHFLTGGEAEIKALTEAVGFRYRWDDESRQFVHQAAIFALTPDGRLSRYLYGVLFEPQTLKLSLLEAGRGKVGSPLDQILMYCFHYDAEQGKYSVAAVHIMQMGALLTALALFGVLIALSRRDARRRRAEPEPTPTLRERTP